MPRLFPLTVSDKLDLRNGTVFEVITVTHTTGANSTIQVDQSATNACELAASGAGLAKEASVSAGVSLATASSGERAVTIASSAATGTYTIVIRYSGSGAGIGSSKP